MIVVKIGGSEGINYDFIADDLATLPWSKKANL
jgi:hypothetical protein